MLRQRSRRNTTLFRERVGRITSNKKMLAKETDQPSWNALLLGRCRRPAARLSTMAYTAIKRQNLRLSIEAVRSKVSL
jgi:hypothetical protein